MARTLALAAGAAAIAAAAGLYALKLDTRRIEARVHALERNIDKAGLDIAVLKSERAWLGRPERIDQLAKAQGLGPIRPAQYRRLQDFSAPVRAGAVP